MSANVHYIPIRSLMFATHTASTVHNSLNDFLQYAPPKTCQHFHAYLIMELGGSTIEECFGATER